MAPTPDWIGERAPDDPQGGIGPSVNCSGLFTRWGGYGDTWHGPYQTQVDVYLDAAYANDPANEDSSVGNLDLIADPTNPDEIGTRFDYTSAINDNTGNHLRDFGFVVGTGQAGNTCAGWVINAQTNVNRNNAFPDDASKDPKCITGTGWYTFKHSFSENAAYNLEVLMEIIPTSVATRRRRAGPSKWIPSRSWVATGTAGSRTKRSSACRSTTRR